MSYLLITNMLLILTYIVSDGTDAAKRWGNSVDATITIRNACVIKKNRLSINFIEFVFVIYMIDVSSLFNKS